MEKAKFLETLIKERGYNLKSFAAECGIPYTTLYGIIKNGVDKIRNSEYDTRNRTNVCVYVALFEIKSQYLAERIAF